jgi:hypothetical protein
MRFPDHVPIRLVDDDILTIKVRRARSDHAILCFSGIGHKVGGVNIQSDEFARASAGATTIFIVDKQRSWGNNFDFHDVAARIAPYTKGRILHALGNSMGGFLAILASRFLPLRTAIAFCPQFSVKSDVVAEHRWRNFTDAITQWRYPSLEGAFGPATRYYLFGTPAGKDAAQLARMPSAPNIAKFWFGNPELAHEEAAQMKADGVLYDVIAQCLAGHAAGDIASSRLANPRYALTLGT